MVAGPRVQQAARSLAVFFRSLAPEELIFTYREQPLYYRRYDTKAMDDVRHTVYNPQMHIMYDAFEGDVV